MSRRLNTVSSLFILSVFAISACTNNDRPADNSNQTPRADAPATLTYSTIASYPHDTALYTQGLEINGGKLYESTGSGSYAGSFLLESDLKSGKSTRKIALDKQYFGEGITIMGDTVYQLTWQSKKAFAYRLSDFKLLAEYPLNHEGWGLSNNGTELIASDGTSKLYFYEPGTFRLLRTQSITEAGNLTYNLNELEYANGYLYANQYQTPYVFRIDLGLGVVVGKANLTDLWNRAKSINPGSEVPNGIAFDSSSNHFFVTGKLWPEMYEVAFGN